MELQEETAEVSAERPSADELLAGALADLGALLRPYQGEWRRREKLSKFLEQCIRAAQRDDFFQILELLGQKEARAASEDPDLSGVDALLGVLRARAEARVDAYQLQFLEDLRTLAAEAELPLEIDFPRLSSRKGIDGSVDFAGRKTTLNGVVLSSVDPRRIVAQLQRLDRRLYGRPFDPVAFVDGLEQTYQSMTDAERSQPVPIRDFYLRHVLSLQSGAFLQDMDKRRFRGYPLDEFSVDLWRFFSSDVRRTTGGRVLALRPGRNQSLWLLDRDGERRQITHLSFQDAT